MKKLLLLIIIAISGLAAKAQTDDIILQKDSIVNEYKRNLPLLNEKIEFSDKFSFNRLLDKKIYIKDTRKDLNLDPGLRYFAYDLDTYESDDLEFVEALGLLSKYVKNDSVRRMASYMQKYAESTAKHEAALKEVKSIYKKLSIKRNKMLLSSPRKNKDSIELLKSKLEDLDYLVNLVEKDESYDWIKKISRDSVQLSLKNYTNDSLNLWVKSGRKHFYRFWIKNLQNDSIGAWVETTKDNAIKIIVDHDVYQESMKDEHTTTKKPLIVLIDSSFMKIKDLYPYEIYYTKWRYASIVKFGLNQGKLANWQKDGENSIAGSLDFNTFCNYRYRNVSWENNLNYKYGIMQAGDEQLKKTEDLLEINSKFGLKAYNFWYFTTLFNFKSQLFNGYDYLDDDKREVVSSFMSPAYILASIGLDYKPSKDLSVMISPFTGKYTIISDTLNTSPIKYGLKQGETVKSELGFYFKTIYNWKISDKIKLANEFGSFYAYDGDSNEIDIDWKTTLEMKINYFISTKIFTHILYDKTVSKKLQFKELLNIGFTYYL